MPAYVENCEGKINGVPRESVRAVLDELGCGLPRLSWHVMPFERDVRIDQQPHPEHQENPAHKEPPGTAPNPKLEEDVDDDPGHEATQKEEGR